MNDADVLNLVNSAFSTARRPEHFTNYKHCDECAEHDALLRSRDNDSLSLDDVGNPGWDPLCFVDAAGFAYFFPALARITLAEPDSVLNWYGPQLLFHLTYARSTREQNKLIAAFDSRQREAVTTLLRHLAETRLQLAEDSFCSDQLQEAISLWSISIKA